MNADTAANYQGLFAHLKGVLFSAVRRVGSARQQATDTARLTCLPRNHHQRRCPPDTGVFVTGAAFDLPYPLCYTSDGRCYRLGARPCVS